MCALIVELDEYICFFGFEVCLLVFYEELGAVVDYLFEDVLWCVEDPSGIDEVRE